MEEQCYPTDPCPQPPTDGLYHFEILPPEVIEARIKELLEVTWEASGKPDKLVLVTSRGVGKSYALALQSEMLAKIAEVEGAKKDWHIIGVDECLDMGAERLRHALRESMRMDGLDGKMPDTFNRLTVRLWAEPEAIAGFPREKAQWKREMNLHPAQRRNMHRGQLAQRSYRGRGG